MQELIKERSRIDAPTSDALSVEFAYPGSGVGSDSVASTRGELPKLTFDEIRLNYTEDVSANVDHLLESVLPNAESGLIIVHGPTGTSKTHLLRALLSEAGRQAVV